MNPERIARTMTWGRYMFLWSGSSVGIATDYALDGPGSNPSGDEISAHPDQPWGPPSLL